jgi:hypothetical protein
VTACKHPTKKQGDERPLLLLLLQLLLHLS